MPITEADLPHIRRLEAVSFRSFPATTTYFNGSWAVRLTAGLPAKRLNSVNPLDPFDTWNIKQRLNRELQRFGSFGRPMVFRLTPLAPKTLSDHLFASGWNSFDESIVMTLNLAQIDLSDAVIRLPFKDTGLWVDAVLELGNQEKFLKPGKVEVIKAIEAETGLFILKDANGIPRCALRAVLDNEMLGLFSLATSQQSQRKGLAKSLMRSALSWARQQGAKTAWLQVEKSNMPAIALYRHLGFQTAYSYVYAQPLIAA